MNEGVHLLLSSLGNKKTPRHAGHLSKVAEKM
jgi:hypothetical protein